jgi:hypothetical protein
VLELLDRNPPAGYGRWNGRLIAQHLGDVSTDQVWRILRQQGIELERRHGWCISTDPEFARKAADIIGLYLNPPQNALIFAIDEKPAIQALERAQGWIRLPNGKALTAFSHEYKRHGTSTLFAALNLRCVNFPFLSSPQEGRDAPQLILISRISSILRSRVDPDIIRIQR